MDKVRFLFVWTACLCCVLLCRAQEIVPPYDSTELYTTCANEGFLWQGEWHEPLSSDFQLTHTISDPVQDTLITLYVTVLPFYTDIIDTQETCKGTPYEWEGFTYWDADDYTRTLTSSLGCDSTVTLRLIVHERYELTDEPVVMCNGEPFEWNDEIYDESGIYTQTLHTIHDCDSIVTREVTIVPVIEPTEFTVERCEGEDYEWEGDTYDESGDYPKTLTSVLGCDSLVTLHLIVHPRYTDIEETVDICEGESYVWECDTYDETGNYTKTLTTIHGCDSIVTLHLIVHEPYDITDEPVVMCDGEPFVWNDSTYEESGIYTQTLTSIYGCDSVVTREVTIHPAIEPTHFTIEICEGEEYEWESETFDESGDYPKTLIASTSCDSLVTLHLIVHPTYPALEETHAICEGTYYDWNGERYSEAGDYVFESQTQFGCDSIVTLHLSLLPRYEREIIDTVIYGDTLTIGEHHYTKKGVYIDTLRTIHGCDSVITLQLTINKVEVRRVIADDQCADDPALEITIKHKGFIHQVEFLFDEKAHEIGLQDILLPMTEDGVLSIPFTARAGACSATVHLIFRGQVVDTLTVPIMLRYPSSVLEQAWNDVIAVLTPQYNGGYDFVAFQWYENDRPLAGETHGYLYRPLRMGLAYSALLTEPDGTQLMTCPIIATEQPEVSLYPTMVVPNQLIHCTVHEKAELVLYDTAGRMITSRTLDAGENLFPSPAWHGMYIAIIRTLSSGKERNYKIMVQ